jgi:hypothetical protein
MVASPQPVTGEPRRRPFGVVVVAVIQVAVVLLTLGVWISGARLPWDGPLTDMLRDTGLAHLAALTYVVIAVAAAVGLWLIRSWGWLLMLAVVTIGLAFDIAAWWRGSHDDLVLAFYMRMTFDVVSAFYLNSAAVRDTFARRPPTPAPGPVSTSAAGRVDP